jgi:hypothetical protein
LLAQNGNPSNQPNITRSVTYLNFTGNGISDKGLFATPKGASL